MYTMVILASKSENLSIFSPTSPPAEAIRDLSLLVFAITGFIFIVVEGVLLYSVIRFRRKAVANSESASTTAAVSAGAVSAGGEAEPPQVYGSKPIEIAWTAAPALIVFILVLVNTRALWEVNIDPPQPRPGDQTLFVTVIGRQWWWEYRYDYYDGKELGFTTANELHFPVSTGEVPRPVYLTLLSADVCHSYWVPRLAGKTDLIPGQTNYMWFQTEEPGLYFGQCAEYCGTQHANMLIRVYADTPEEFGRWLENEARDAPALPAGDKKAELGKEVFLNQTCVSCHRVRGTPAEGTYAPDLTHLMSRQTLASGMVPNAPDGQNLRKWLDDPQKVKPGCLMPAFVLSRDDRNFLLRYLLTLH
jgi:cytochrome c oxidase subunit 2